MQKTTTEPIVLAVTLGEQGGVQQFILRLAVHLRRQNLAVHIVAGHGMWLEQQCQQFNLTFHRLTHLKRSIHPWHDLLAYRELRNLLSRLRPVSILLNSSKMGVLGSRAARSLHLNNIIYRIGGWSFLEPMSSVSQTIYRTAERLSAPWKDTIVCVHPGDEIIARNLSITPAKQLLTIPNGLNSQQLTESLLPRQQARTYLDLPQQAYVIGTIANFFPAKGLLPYLDAASVLLNTIPHAHICILGDGMERRRAENIIAKRGQAQRIHLPGAISPAAQYLKAFDIFVLPSLKEGMSWALLEAMASGLPCIATDVGANAWLIGADNGWIVPTNDVQSLIATINAVHNEPDLALMRGQQAATRVANNFGEENMLKAYTELLTSS